MLVRWLVLLPLLATALEATVRLLAPLPYAPAPADLVLAWALYALAALPGLGLDACGGPLRRIAPFAGGAVFASFAANLAYAAGTRSGMMLGVIAAGVLLLAAPLAAARARTLVGALAVLALVLPVRLLATSPRRADTRLPSVLVVVLDTTSASHLSLYGYPRPTSPELEALAARGVVFTRAIAPAPWTLPSHGALFTGLSPGELGFDGDGFHEPADTGSIAADLTAAGRSAYGISANPIVAAVPELHDGFRRLWGANELSQPLLVKAWGRLRGVRDDDGFQTRGARITGLALDWLDRVSPRGEPWFLFLNYLDPHDPYRPPAAERARFAPGVNADLLEDDIRAYNSGASPLSADVLADLRALYDGEVAAADAALGRLLAELARRGYDESNLLVVVTADHGESIGEHGFVGHLIGMPDVVLHVPLVLAGLGLAPGRVDTPVQPLQVRATIRALTGLPPIPGIAPALPPWGEAPPLLVSENSEKRWYCAEMRAVAPDFDCSAWRGDWVALERDGMKVVFDDDGRGATYDLRRDPAEAHPAPLAAGLALVRAYRERALVARRDGAGELPAETRRALQSIGYVR